MWYVIDFGTKQAETGQKRFLVKEADPPLILLADNEIRFSAHTLKKTATIIADQLNRLKIYGPLKSQEEELKWNHVETEEGKTRVAETMYLVRGENKPLYHCPVCNETFQEGDYCHIVDYEFDPQLTSQKKPSKPMSAIIHWLCADTRGE